tara:strand:- start:722 stop:928 length:207 start_codon:yes stop_codon:yes gene_type:complete
MSHTGLKVVEGPLTKTRRYQMRLSVVISQGTAIFYSGDLPVDLEHVMVPHIFPLSMKHPFEKILGTMA